MPYKYGSFLYYTRTVQGLAYKLHCRKPVSGVDMEEQVVLDENELATDKDYCDIGACEPSPSHNLLAYAADFVGEEGVTAICT